MDAFGRKQLPQKCTVTLPEVDEDLGRIFPSGGIVGGEGIDISKVPYTLAPEFSDSQICGASILAPRVALTAAHCVRGLAAVYFAVRTGTSKRHSGGTVHEVNHIITHPKYDDSRHDSDVALLFLEMPIIFGDKSKPISIIEKELTSGNVLVIGWGDNKEGGGWGWYALQCVSVPIVRRADCEKAYAGKVYITAKMFCAGAPGKDSCQGDSGGPAAIGGKLDGVVSFGIGCGRPGYPGVYVNVAHPEIRNWIRENAKV